MPSSPRKRLRSNPSSSPYQQLEPRQMLAGDTPVGDLNWGVAISDNATGSGYILFSEEVVHTRFSGLNVNNADHFVGVRLDGNQWQYNDNLNWHDFQPAETDLLVAQVNFSGDNAGEIKGRTFVVNGINAGSLDSDLFIAPNRWNNSPNAGEFQIYGTTINVPDTSQFDTTSVKLHEIFKAASAYHDDHHQFPHLAMFDADGNPMLSWRVELLPYLGMSDLYQQFNLDEPWDSPNNLALVNQIPDVFTSHLAPEEAGLTVYMAVGGEGTAFPHIAEDISFDDMRDGAGNTLMFAEANSNRAVPWTQPVDLSLNSNGIVQGVGANADSFRAVMADGQVYELPNSIAAENLANMVLIDDGNVVDFSFAPNSNLQHNLNVIAGGLGEYSSRFREFPAHAIYNGGDTPLLSWRVAILPYIGQQNLYDQFNLDEPWNSTHNSSLIDQMPQAFGRGGLLPGMTTVLGVAGENSAFPIEDDGKDFNSFSYDGHEHSLIAVNAGLDQAVPWTQPTDLLFDPAAPLAGVSDGFLGIFADARVENVPATVSDATMTATSLIFDNGIVDWREYDSISSDEVNLRTIGLAALNRNSSHGRLPAHAIYSADNSTPLLSWRVQLLPYLGYTTLYDRFRLDEPWDSAHNMALVEHMPRIYASPDVADGETIYMVSTGDETAFPLTPQGTRLESIRDPHDQTILIAQADLDQAAIWTRPVDLSYDPADPSNGLQAGTASGNFIAYADGTTGLAPNFLNDATLSAMLEINDGIVIDTSTFVPSPIDGIHNRTISNKIRIASIAIHNYHDSFRELPHHATFADDGTPLLSWRVQMLPYMGYQSLYDQFNQDEPWNSAHNLSLLPLMPDVFAHPSVPNGQTVMQAVVGPEMGETTMWPGTTKLTLERVSNADGTSNTIMVVAANADQAVPWTAPYDIVFNPDDPAFGLGTESVNGMSVSFGDASARFINQCVPADFLRARLTYNDGEFTPPSSDGCNDGEVKPTDVSGSGGDDLINVVIGADDVSVTINGDLTVYSRSEYDQLFFDAMDGNDTITIVDDAGDNMTTLEPGQVAVDGEFKFFAKDVETTYVTSGGGYDTAIIEDTSGDDLFKGRDSVSEMTGGGFSQSVEGYNEVRANSSDGNDTARLYDSSSDDSFVGTQSYARMTFGDTFPGLSFVHVNQFDLVAAVSENGGNDTASMTGSEGNERFFGTENTGRMVGEFFILNATGFGLVLAKASGGVDTARLTDSAMDDDYYARPDFARITMGAKVIRVLDFDRVTARSPNGGNDTATLNDSEGDDKLVASPLFASLRNDNFFIAARGFDEVRSLASSGFDTAAMTDSSGNDQFNFEPSESLFSGDNFYNMARGFDQVSATASSGTDQATLNDSDGNDQFYATPLVASLEGDSFRAFTRGFDRVRALASNGMDTATLVDSADSDQFSGSATTAYLRNDNFYNEATGFDRVVAISNSGDDTAQFLDSEGDDLFLGSALYSYMMSAGYHNQVNGFSSVVGLGGQGNDVANWYDSEGDDTLGAADTRAWMSNGTYSLSARQFTTVNAVSSNGGEDRNNAGDDLEFELNATGDWL